MRRDRHPLLRISRLPTVLGFALVAGGAFMPWQTMTYSVGAPVVTRGTDTDAAPGLQILTFALAVLVLVSLRSVADSQTRTIQLAPSLFGAACLAIALQGYRSVAPTHAWDPAQSSSVVVEGGMWATLAGATLVALGGLAATIIMVRRNPVAVDPENRSLGRTTIELTVAGAIGFVAGLGAVIWLGASVLGNGAATILVAVPLLVIAPGLAIVAWSAIHAAYARARTIRADEPPVPRERVRRL